MKRDYSEFPDDENGDILFSMSQDGDDLSKPRDIDFSVVFSNEDAAKQFEYFYCHEGLKAETTHHTGQSDSSWDVVVTKFMLPTHKNITNFESELQKKSARLGGRNDGWGCFAQS